MSSSTYSVNLLGSSIDVATIVQNLMYVERAPVRSMQNKVASLEKKVSAYQDLNTKLSALSDKLNAILYPDKNVPLSLPSAFSDRLSKSLFSRYKLISSDEKVLTATAEGFSGGGTYSIKVNNLAQAQTMVSASFADINATSIGTGTITITRGNNAPITITIGETNSTLSGLRDAINSARAGVTASIIKDGTSTPYRLMLTADNSGTTNSFTVDVALSGGQPLSLEQTQEAADAQFSINGISLTASSNTVSDAIKGMTLTLRDTSTSPVTLRAERDTDSLVAAMNEFVSAYNAVNSFINSQFRYSSETGSAGVLAGDATLRRVQSMIQLPLTQSVINTYTHLAVASQAGLEFNRDGSLSFNETEFRNALNENFTAVAALFLGNGTPAGGVSVTDNRVTYVGRSSNTEPGTYSIYVDSPAQRATLLGNQSLTSLLEDETLTITGNTATATVYLLQGDSLSTILFKINSALTAQGIAATAKDDGSGRILIQANDYGSAHSLTIESNKEDLPGTTGFGITPITVSGTDIAGKINGHTAIGSGLTLSGATGYPEEGLSVSISQTTSGSYGTITLAPESKGIVGASVLMNLFVNLKGLSDPLAGPIGNAMDGLKKSISLLNDQISSYEERLSKREALLTAEYDRADQALRLMTVLQSSLESQISSLSKYK